MSTSRIWKNLIKHISIAPNLSLPSLLPQQINTSLKKATATLGIGIQHTFVPPHPNLKAASCANSSPNPNIKPLTNGSNRLIATPRSIPHRFGGVYSIRGGDIDEDGGEGESSSLPEYCSESDGIVIEDSSRGLIPSDAILTRICERERELRR